MKGGYYIQKMKDINLLNGKGFALDVGSNTGFDSLELKKLGYTVIAIDKKDFPPVEGVTFIKADIVDFPIEKGKYSFILCNNTFPFIQDKKQVRAVLRKMADGLAPDGSIHFTLFGPNDEWADDPAMSFYTYEEAIKEVERLPFEIIEKSNFDGYAVTMKGEPKHAEMHRFTCRRRN